MAQRFTGARMQLLIDIHQCYIEVKCRIGALISLRCWISPPPLHWHLALPEKLENVFNILMTVKRTYGKHFITLISTKKRERKTLCFPTQHFCRIQKLEIPERSERHDNCNYIYIMHLFFTPANTTSQDTWWECDCLLRDPLYSIPKSPSKGLPSGLRKDWRV